MKPRRATVSRKTGETDIVIEVNLDRPHPVAVTTTIPFLDHMLRLFACHANIGLKIRAKGDTEIDDHHLVEDLGISLGKSLAGALGKKKGIRRYGNFLLPMDEALSYVAIDLSGRPFLDYDVAFKCQRTGFDFDLVREFFYALAMNAGMTLHIELKKGRNNHHIAESLFKGFGRALAEAMRPGVGRKGIPSTKGTL